MKVFKEFNAEGKDVCPICKTKDEKEVILIPILGTEEGGNCQALQFHLECLELSYDRRLGLIYQKIEKETK